MARMQIAMDRSNEPAYTTVIMKVFLSTLYVVLLGASATVSGFAQQANSSVTMQSPRFYLHVFTSLEADVTNGPFNSSSLILSTNVHLGEVFEKQSRSGGPPLSVLIEARDGRYFLHLDESWLGRPEYHSEIEPEVPFQPTSKPMQESINSVDFFVLSTNSDYRPVLENLNAIIRKGIAQRSTNSAVKPEGLPPH